MNDTQSNGKPSLPLSWEWVPLSQIAEINPPLDRCVINDNQVVNFVPMRAVEPEGGGLAHPETRPYGEVKKGFTAFLSGDVIMAKITPCMENGKTTVVPDLPGSVCFGSTEFHNIRPEYGIDARWLAYFLLQHKVRQEAQRHMGGAVGQMRVPASFLEKLMLPVAPTAEQVRILDTIDELLSELDAGIAALERVQAKLLLYRAAVLKAAFDGTVTAEWRIIHPATEDASDLLNRILLERQQQWEEEQLRKFTEKGQQPPKHWKAKYKQPVAADATNLPSIPPSWCWATLDQLTTLITSGSRGWKDYYSATGAMFIRSQNIRTDTLDLSDIARVSPPKNSEGIRTKVEQGDLLVTITGANVAKSARVEIQLPEAYVSQHVALIRLVNKSVGQFCHYYVIAPSGGRKQLLTLAYGAGKPGLNLDNLRELPLPLAPCLEQEALVEAVEDQLSIIDHLEADLAVKLQASQSLRQSILRDAFAGKLLRQDPSDGSATAMLRRITAEREERAQRACAPRKPNKPDGRKRLKVTPTTTRKKTANGYFPNW